MRPDPASISSDPPMAHDVDAASLPDMSNNRHFPTGFASLLFSPLPPSHETSGVSSNPNVGQRVQVGRQSMVELLCQTSNPCNPYSFQHFNEAASSGMFGSLQGLVKSFSNSTIPTDSFMGSGGTSLFPSLNEEWDPSSTTIPCAQVDVADSPERILVDESGYDSSESSLYDVASDDEDYVDVPTIPTINCTEEVGVQHEQLPASHGSHDGNGHTCNATEDLEENVNRHGSANVAEEVPDCECLDGNPFMHVITDLGEGNTEETTFKKRNRTAKGVKRPDCRVAKCMGPIEIALRNAPYRKTKYIFEPVLGITFDSDREAYEFYNMYSWEVGFGIKYDNLVRNNQGTATKRDLTCLCSGNPDDANYKSKKTGCKAMIRLLRSKDDGWYISRHVAEHNHPLTDTCGQTNEWKSHGKLDASAIDMVRYLRENNVSLTKVHCIMGSMFGSMENIPMTKRNLRAICRQIAKDQMDADVQKTLDTFRQIRRQDPGFQFSVELDENEKIKTLLWINGKSRQDYQCFGDVITFDTTYSTNIYKMPFGLFVGVNNHFQSTIFGGVFMKEETTKSFKWVFTEFLSLMGGNAPQTVFTDQCAAMAAALSVVWKDSTHLLCKWHIFKDAGPKLGPIYRKGTPFRKLFHKIINDMLTIDEFERAWTYMIELYKLTDNKYLSNIYNKRKKWAKAYFRDCFCARMSSTQRSESANHMLKRFVPRNCSMNRFIVQFNKLLFDRNRAEDRAEFDTKIFNNVRERAWPVEKHAMKFYTSAAYDLLRKEINKSTNYFAKEVIMKKQYDVVHVNPAKKHPWGREKFTVFVCNEGESYDCECGLYKHFGILCSHVMRVFVQLGVYEIPDAHIHKRWTRAARDILPEGLNGYQRDTLCMQSMTFRHGFLYVNALGLVNDGNKDLGAFEIVAKDMKKTQRKLKAYFKAKENPTNNVLQKRISISSTLYTSESDVGGESEYETDARIGNSYGAAGSSAFMSDSELLRIRAPAFNRPVGRPREVRFKGGKDLYVKKGTKRSQRSDNTQNKSKKKLPRCSECEILGHISTQCKNKIVDLTTELPEF